MISIPRVTQEVDIWGKTNGLKIAKDIDTMIKKLKDLFIKKELSKFFDIGFHGDKYLINIVFSCLNQAETFIETGTNVGSTLVFVAKNYPKMKIYSCEPDKKAYNFVKDKIKSLNNVSLFNGQSPDMIISIAKDNPSIKKQDTVFWLDAHDYGYQWPLKQEIEFITHNFKQGYIFIDDFFVPHLDFFKWCKYQNQECSYQYIKDSINPKIEYNLYYPNYHEKTSLHHPLTGWGLICFGHQKELAIPDNYSKNIYQAR